MSAPIKLRRVHDGKWFVGQSLAIPMVTSDPSRAKVVEFADFKRQLLAGWFDKWEIVPQTRAAQRRLDSAMRAHKATVAA